MAFAFYDTETTGLDTAFDQILQFAAIRTDADLNELERFDIRSRLQPHVIPAVQALRTNRTRIERLTDVTLPSHYDMVRAIQANLHAWSPSLFMGYNLLGFDEHLLRQALFQTLHNPYLTNRNGNTRSDVLRLIHAVAVQAPGVLKIPTEDDGRMVFRLDRVAPANGFDHPNAYDAMADVQAMIYLCRIIAEQAPEIWSTFMRFSQKAAAIEFITAEDAYCLCEFFGGKSYAWLVTTLGHNEENTSEYYVFNLSVDPEELIGLDQDALIQRLKTDPKPIRRLRVNAAPFVLLMEEAPENCGGKHEVDTIRGRAEMLRGDLALRSRLIAAYQLSRGARERSPYVERQLYDGFWPEQDAALMNTFHTLPWEQRGDLLSQFSDRRLKQLGRRLLHAERPDLFSEVERRKMDVMRARRVLGRDGDVPWLTLPQALAEIEGAIGEASEEHTEFLHLYRKYIQDRDRQANEALSEPSAAN